MPRGKDFPQLPGTWHAPVASVRNFVPVESGPLKLLLKQDSKDISGGTFSPTVAVSFSHNLASSFAMI